MTENQNAMVWTNVNFVGAKNTINYSIWDAQKDIYYGPGEDY